MKAGELLSVADYLHTSFDDGDREYLDGQVLQRNAGEVEHSDAQSTLVTLIRNRYPQFWAGVAVRVQVSPARFRVPDVCVVAGGQPAGKVVIAAPFLVVEVLSPDDRVADLQEKIDDYLAFGITCVWVVNPKTRRGYMLTTGGAVEAKDGILRAGAIQLSLAELCR